MNKLDRTGNSPLARALRFKDEHIHFSMADWKVFFDQADKNGKLNFPKDMPVVDPDALKKLIHSNDPDIELCMKSIFILRDLFKKTDADFTEEDYELAVKTIMNLERVSNTIGLSKNEQTCT